MVMVKLTTSTTIDRRPDEVFAFISDPANFPQWLSVEDVELDGPLRVGATGSETRRMLGRRLRMQWECTAYAPPERVAFRYPGGPIPADATFTFESAGAGTRVTCSTVLTPRGLFRPLGRLVAREARKEDEGNFRRLKEVLESR
jgi:uncharacterized protein YndB with AHSA1/START domain